MVEAANPAKLLRRNAVLGAHPPPSAHRHCPKKLAEGLRSVRRLEAETNFARSRSGQRSGELVKPSYLAVYRSARLIEVQLPGMPVQQRSKRRVCEGMSEESKRRLLKLLSTIVRSASLPHFVTLTFPSELRVTPSEAKACLRAYAKRMALIYPHWCHVWRLEAHPELSLKLGRVHPHLHLLVWAGWLDYDKLKEVWASVVLSVLSYDAELCDGEGRWVRQKHRAAGVDAQVIRTWAGVPYVAKTYIAKAEEYPLGKAGRVWGWFNGDNLPVDKPEMICLSPLQVSCVQARLAEFQAARRIITEFPLRHLMTDDPSALASWLMSPPIGWRETMESAEEKYRAGTIP